MMIQKKGNRGASEFHIEISIPNLEALIRPPIKKWFISCPVGGRNCGKSGGHKMFCFFL